jgi:hypothetical protein
MLLFSTVITVFCYLVVKCGSGREAKNAAAAEFRCHKIMIRGFLARQLGRLADIEEEVQIEEVLLPDTDPAAFRRYLDLVYGLAAGDAATMATSFGLEADPALRDSVEEILLSTWLPAIQGKFYRRISYIYILGIIEYI